MNFLPSVNLARSIHATLALWLSLTLVGCGAGGGKYDASVEGTVTVDGDLAQRGSVTFYPVKSGPAAAGQIFKDGSYSVRVGQGSLAESDAGKLPSGEYVATVVVSGELDKSKTVSAGGPPMAGVRLSAAKYADRATSGLKFSVKPGRNVLELKLDSAASDPPLEPEATPPTTDGVGESGESAPPAPALPADQPEETQDSSPEAAGGEAK